jgi:hypothetical protein
MSCGDSGWRKMRREKPLQFYAPRGVGAKATLAGQAAGAGLSGNLVGTDLQSGSCGPNLGATSRQISPRLGAPPAGNRGGKTTNLLRGS